MGRVSTGLVLLAWKVCGMLGRDVLGGEEGALGDVGKVEA